MKTQKTKRRRVRASAELSRADIIRLIAPVPMVIGDDRKGAMIRLAGINLSGLDLSGLNLSHVDFSNSILTGVNFLHARLHGSLFFGADLSRCNFRLAEMDGSIHGDEVVLLGANLDSANLIAVNLRNAIVEGANFTNADLRSADLSCAEAAGAIFTGAKLEGANFDGTILTLGSLNDAAPAKLYLGRAVWWAKQDTTNQPAAKARTGIQSNRVVAGRRLAKAGT